MSLLFMDKANITKSRPSHFEQRESVNPMNVLEELVELIEEYGPSWYTEEHHNRAVAALLSHWPVDIRESARRT